MQGVGSPLLASTIEQVRMGWAERLEVPHSALHDSVVTLVASEGIKNLVVLELLDSVVAVCPPSIKAILEPLTKIELLDVDFLRHLLSQFHPTPVGIATIGYADSATICSTSNFEQVSLASEEVLAQFRSECTDEEIEESGIQEMPYLFAARSNSGAVAGYEVWNSKIAQMGVLAIPRFRGTGLAFAAAQFASLAAMEAKLIPQWRCRIGNEPSYRLSKRLGFQDLGRQLAIELTL